jgi:hypothetical protein
MSMKKLTVNKEQVGERVPTLIRVGAQPLVATIPSPHLEPVTWVGGWSSQGPFDRLPLKLLTSPMFGEPPSRGDRSALRFKTGRPGRALVEPPKIQPTNLDTTALLNRHRNQFSVGEYQKLKTKETSLGRRVQSFPPDQITGYIRHGPTSPQGALL